MDKNGADAVHNSTEQFANLVKIEAGKYGNIVKKLGIKLDWWSSSPRLNVVKVEDPLSLLKYEGVHFFWT